jgi:hypothetical protein
LQRDSDAQLIPGTAYAQTLPAISQDNFMTPEILKKSGYRMETTEHGIIIKSSRRPIEFLIACFITLWIGFAVIYAVPSENLIAQSILYIIYLILLVAPFSVLFFIWTQKTEINAGRVRIIGTISGEIDNSHILSIQTKTEQSTINKRVTILLRDSETGLIKLFVLYVKPKDMRQLHDFVNQIRKTIGLEDDK